jgi:hypothetical protein
MLLGPHNITLFLGNYGSGKTEVSVNFAIQLARKPDGPEVILADLDLVNPYFRSREPREAMTSQGIRVILPDQKYMHADLPILVPGVRAELMAAAAAPAGSVHVILDVGGDDVGARVLGALKDALPAGSFRALMVLNANRPLTSDLAGIRQMRMDIERAGDLAITGFVSNTHLMEQTDIKTIIDGGQLAHEAAEACGLPLEFVCVPAKLVAAAVQEIEDELLPMWRYLSTPWTGQGTAPREFCKVLSGL